MSRLQVAGVFALVAACGSHSTTIGELFPPQGPAGGASTAGGEAGTPTVGGAEPSGASGGGGASVGDSAGNPSAGQDLGPGGAAGAGGVGDSAGGAAGCLPPAYPTGPYGVVQGAVVDGGLSFQVYAPGSDALTPSAMRDYFEAAHCRGVRALYVVELEVNDATAESATTEIQQQLNGAWQGGAVEVLELVTRGSAGAAATPADAKAWRDAHAATWLVGADAAEAFHDGSGYFPQLRLVIDPCTMRVTRWVHRDDVVTDLNGLVAGPGCGP